MVATIFSLHLYAEELKEYGCGVMYKEDGSDKTQFMQTPKFHMTDYNE